MNIYIDNFIKKALEEDLGVLGDITTENLFDDKDKSVAYINTRENTVLAGINIARRVFEIVDPQIKFQILKKDGAEVKKNSNIAKISGKTKSILIAERLALNILQRMSGIATNANIYVNKINKYNVKVADSRKTTPLFRYFEKLAVKIGGGSNHRFNLSDAVMIKDNHIVASGGINKAVAKIKKNISHTTKIEIEVENYKEAKEALQAGVDIIMLDNIRGKELEKCVKLLKNKVIVEASGNIDIESIEGVAKTGVDIISTGAMIYNAKNIDIGLDFIG